VVDVASVTYRRVTPTQLDRVAQAAQQHWDVVDDRGHVIARAEVFESPTQWGVRLHDRVPEVADGDLIRMVATLLVWHAKCPTDTVDVVLARTHEHQVMVKVGADFV
jgi:hypothetical protein